MPHASGRNRSTIAGSRPRLPIGPATWRGNAVPKTDDEVTIRKGDLVVFDRNDDRKATCQKLFIDPQGALKFKSSPTQQKGTWQVKFTKAGTYNYVCTIHPWVRGELVIARPDIRPVP